MCSRSNEEIKAIKAAYKRLLFSLSQASRNEGDDVDLGTAAADAQALLDAGEASWGTDESRFNVILAQRSFAQLEQIFSEYENLSEKGIEAAIKSEMSGDIEDGMLAIVRCARS